MNQTLASSLIGIVFLLGACTGRIDTQKTNGGIANGPNPNGNAPGNQATVVGNGAIKTISYRNESLGLAFDYPSNWNAKGTENSAVLSNDSFAASDKTSRLEFGTYPELVPNKPFAGKNDLLQYLQSNFKKSAWSETNLIGHSGYWSENIQGKHRQASYYLLDPNRNVIRVELTSYADFDGEEVISAVIRQLTIDTKGPNIQAIYFSPAKARPGDTVKLVIIADDSISGLDVSKMNSSLPYQSLGEWQQPRLGYVIPNKDQKQQDYYHYNLANAYPLWKKFKLVSPGRIEYEFTVPRHAAEGEIGLKYLKVTDRLRNESTVDCYTSSEEKFVCDANLPTAAPKLRVTAGEWPGYFADHEPPVYQGARFQKTFVFSDHPEQKLFLRLTDNGVLKQVVRVSANAFRRGGSNNADCVKWGHELKPVDDEKDLYYVEVDTSNCFRTYDSDGHSPLEIVRLNNLDFFDEVGNVRSCNDYFNTACRIEEIQFEIKR